MALQFNPPEWLLQEYMNRKRPIDELADQTRQISEQALQSRQQEQASRQANLGNYLKLLELDPQLVNTPIGQQLQQGIGGGLGNYQPPTTSSPTAPSPMDMGGSPAPMGSPVVAHFNELMGRGKLGEKAQGQMKTGMEMQKLAVETGPQEMYDQSGKHITTLPPGSKVVPTERPTPPSPEEREAGKKQAKLQFEKPKAKGSLDITLHEYDNMINLAKQIANDTNLSEASGVATPLGRVYGAKARGVRQRLETLKGKTLLNVMSGLKQLSSTGSTGFGQMSNIEGETIKNSVTTLDPGQPTEDLKNSLMAFANEMDIRKQNLVNTYQDTYGEPYQMPSYMNQQNAGSGGWGIRRKN